MVGSTHRHPRLGRLAGILLRTQPDDRLAEMSREGATAPFDEIVRRHRPALIAFAGTLAPPSRAEDVVQESLLKAYSALQRGAEPEILRAWLFRIVRNTAIDEHRGVRHHEQLDESYDGVEQPPQALDRREQIAALVAAIGDLPPAQREAIVKRELEGRGHTEIGRALDLSPGAVRQLIYRARHTLRKAAGALVPVAVVRAASLPGADEAVGGIGMAGAVKLGLVAIAATGTIVASSSIQRHDDSGRAEAVQISTPGHDSGADPSETLADDRLPEDGGHRDSHRDRGRDDSGNSGPGGGGGVDSSHSGPGSDGLGGNSGPGSDSSGPGPSGSDGGVSGSSGPDGDGDLISSGSGDGGGGGGTSGGSGSDDALAPIDGTSSGPG